MARDLEGVGMPLPKQRRARMQLAGAGLRRLRIVAHREGRPAEARDHPERALALFQELDHPRGVAATLRARGEFGGPISETVRVFAKLRSTPSVTVSWPAPWL